ncbi:hypothetical protein GCM10011584_11300 [Nocardioides phosphati]|uniref:WD40 repeat domain-containing protein n=1 Tax=Nocardioides phosphati TaxID=1867775 RepID=A0ABQ2N9G4_9ACTN|nr:hypothetical protein [Nocardioides phosphati]GGO87218.1 hypothetical protein GCM10011584_11300 [Nocardioides phosphati]
MTNDLRDLLDDVADAPARAVRVDARTAWADGARRRVRRRVTVGALGLAAVAAVVASAPLLHGTSRVTSYTSQPEAHTDHYPQRLDYDYVGTAMPAVTGPLAGVVQRGSEHVSGNYAVSPGGRMWRIDDAYGQSVSISPDGIHLVYLRGPDAPNALLTITDQNTGERTTFSKIGMGASEPAKGRNRAPVYFHSDQQPAFWNRDSTKVLLQLGASDGYDVTAAGILSVDGEMTIVQNSRDVPGGSQPIGWVDDNTVAFVVGSKPGARVVFVDAVTSRTVRSFPLKGARSDAVSQWYGWLTPDGAAVMTLDDDFGGRTDARVRFYSAEAGDRAGTKDATMPVPDGRDDTCQPTLTRRETYVAVDADAREDGAILARVNGGTPIVADPRLHVTCSVWASSALEGGPDPSIGGRLFGTESTWLSWHWRELIAGALVLVAAGGALAVVRRRRR